MRLWYGADKSRCLSRKAAGGEVSLKYYFSKLYELEQRKGGERLTCYIYANGRPVSIVEEFQDNFERIYYNKK